MLRSPHLDGGWGWRRGAELLPEARPPTHPSLCSGRSPDPSPVPVPSLSWPLFCPWGAGGLAEAHGGPALSSGGI